MWNRWRAASSWAPTIRVAPTYFVREPALVEAVDADERACMRRVDEVTVADVDPDVPGRLARAVGAGEEDEVARLEPVRRNPDGVGRVPLRRRVVRQRDAELREYVP